MESFVVTATQWRSDPDQVLSTTNMVTFYAFAIATYHTCRTHRSASSFHEPPPTET